MPLYEYQCANCSKIFEKRHGFHDESDNICPHCHGHGIRMFSPVAVIYKGSGFYSTDYKSGKSAAAISKTDQPNESPVESATAKSEPEKSDKTSKTSTEANKAEVSSTGKKE